MSTFRVLHGVALSREAWLTVLDAGHLAFAGVLGDDYGNLMEARMVADEMGDTAYVAHIDALVTRATDARLAAEKAAALNFSRE